MSNTHNFALVPGNTWVRNFTWTSGGSAVNMTGYTATFLLISTHGVTMFTGTVGSGISISTTTLTVTIAAATTANFADNGDYTLTVTSPGGVVTTICSGFVTLDTIGGGSVDDGDDTVDVVTIGVQGPQGVAGAAGTAGATGAAGPNTVTSSTTTNLTGYFKGNGTVCSAVTTLPATDLTGTIADARLSSNICLKNADNGFSVGQTVTGTITATAFVGGGSGITVLNASNISSGTLADARLSSNVPLKNGTNVYTGGNTFGSITATSVDAQQLSLTGAYTNILTSSGFTSASGHNFTIQTPSAQTRIDGTALAILKSGGVAGTDELQISHNGIAAIYVNRNNQAGGAITTAPHYFQDGTGNAGYLIADTVEINSVLSGTGNIGGLVFSTGAATPNTDYVFGSGGIHTTVTGDILTLSGNQIDCSDGKNFKFKATTVDLGGTTTTPLSGNEGLFLILIRADAGDASILQLPPGSQGMTYVIKGHPAHAVNVVDDNTNDICTLLAGTGVILCFDDLGSWQVMITG